MNYDKCLAYTRAWLLRNPDKVRESIKRTEKKYGRTRSQLKKERMERLKIENPEEWARRRTDQNKRMYLARMANPKRRIKHRLTCRIGTALKRTLKMHGKGNKSTRTMELIGCSMDFVLVHLESQFKPGMTWQNHGIFGWHVDHIIPCASFDLTNPEQQRKCFHYSNLQPLWAVDNLIKSDTIIPTQPQFTLPA